MWKDKMHEPLFMGHMLSSQMEHVWYVFAPHTTQSTAEPLVLETGVM